MAQLNIPNLLVQGTTINAAPFNANFNAVALAVNSIDNSNMGAAGIFASQIIPTTAVQGTFGGTAGYTFPATGSGTASLLIGSGTGPALSFIGSGPGNFIAVGNAFNVQSSGAVVIASLAAAVTPLSVSMIASQSVPGLLINGAASITGNLLQVDLTSGGTHALTLSSTGTLAVQTGITVNGAFIQASGDIGAGRTATGGMYWYGNGTVSQAASFDYGLNTSGAFSAMVNGVAQPIRASAFTVISDASLKQNIRPIVDALATFMQLKPSAFEWIHNSKDDVGFIAQEVEGVLPQMVSADNSGSKGIAYHGITALLAAAFQEYVATHP